MTRATITGVCVALLVAATGCGGGDKAGGSGGQLTLRIGTNDQPGRPSNRAIEELARQANALSDGRLRIEPVFGVQNNAPEWDQRVARMVRDGDLDIAVIPARAWDTEGVTSLRALHAPFLVNSQELMERIATGDIAGEMLAGLDRAGVVGLALLPEDLRHPFGFGGPLRSPEDFDGRTIRVPRSDVVYSTVRQLGATPLDVSGARFTRAVADGSIGGADSGFALASAVLPRTAFATANVTLYPKVNSLVIGRAAWERLSENGRALLREAAARTQQRLLATLVVDDREAAKAYCERGGNVVLADAADLAALSKAVEPVYDELERDVRTKALIARIRELKREVREPAPAVPCHAPPAPEPAGGTGDPHVLDGVWRMNVSYAEGIKAGLMKSVADDELGLQTIRMNGGRYDWRWRARGGERRCPGTYTIDGNTVVFTDTGECATSVWTATFKLEDSAIAWSAVRSLKSGNAEDQTIRELLHIRAWRRIADVGGPAVDFPDGIYRARITVADLVERGVDEATAATNSGLVTMTFDDGRWLHHTQSPTDEPDCGGVYAVHDGRVSITLNPGPECGSAAGGELFSAAWTLHGSELRFRDVRSGEGLHLFARAFWGAHAWTKIR